MASDDKPRMVEGPVTDCIWCDSAILPDDDVEERYASTRIGELVPMHAECATEWDEASGADDEH